ncbi:hypothetical protein IFM89_014576 [Coptis chinensis]|uniref:SGNH hydrolase-type esterase domain-containing protein n=1 Tax=Coptis chinensis TaxID=261450 RepID=A0A835LBU8_9MAGN|nr:hypothetical protein IFM89_014576 [Coptis chinensis]
MRPKIILFGDSITEESFDVGGWGAALAHHFCRTVDVVLRGYSGYNTRWALLGMDKIFPVEDGASSPIAVTIFFGANDACLSDRSSAFQHVPLHEYKQNLNSIISLIKKRWPSIVVLLVTPPPIDEDGRLRYPYGDNHGVPERTNEAAGAYAKECVTIGEECGVSVVDVWSKMQQFPDWGKSFLRDGLHLTPSGNKIVFEEVLEKLKKAGLGVDTLPVDLPVFSDIDPNDPLKAFQSSDISSK